MDTAFKDIIKTICDTNNLDFEKVLKDNEKRIKEYLDEYEDPEIHLRCKGRNKNGKRCSKSKKDNADYCSVHFNQQKDKDSEFISSEKLDKSEDTSVKSSNNIQILDNKKKGIMPEKIKKITYESKKYYINKNDWIYEMNQDSEIISSDIPIGRLFSGKLVILKIDEI